MFLLIWAEIDARSPTSQKFVGITQICFSLFSPDFFLQRPRVARGLPRDFNGKGWSIPHAKHCREILPSEILYVSVEMTRYLSIKNVRTDFRRDVLKGADYTANAAKCRTSEGNREDVWHELELSLKIEQKSLLTKSYTKLRPQCSELPTRPMCERSPSKPPAAFRQLLTATARSR